MEKVKSMPREAREPAKSNITLRDLRWPDFVPVAIAAALFLWLYMRVFEYWYLEWMKKESYYSHAILVPFISGFIVWLKRKQILEAVLKPAAIGYLLILPCMVIFVFMTWAHGSSPQGLMFPAIIYGIVLVFFGKAMARQLRFPIGYLFFMCVLPGDVLTKLSFRIQMISTIGATGMLRLGGYDAVREGAAINLPNIEVMVGAPCSGFRMLISLFAFAFLLAYLKEGPRWGRISMILVTLPLSVLLNSMRITMIALVGEYLGSEAMRAFHDYSGYIVLALAFVLLSLFARLVKCQKFSSMLTSS
jgi:exosortase